MNPQPPTLTRVRVDLTLCGHVASRTLDVTSTELDRLRAAATAINPPHRTPGQGPGLDITAVPALTGAPA